MASEAAFRADRWVRREIVTDELDWLGDEICRRTGRPRTAAGTKGDRHHVSGGHRSQEFLAASPLCTNRKYTVQPGLTVEQARHVAAFDFTPGSAAQMIAQSRRLIAAMRGGRLDEVRECFGNVDGDRVVDGWDNVHDRAVTSDSSHLWHWHLTLDRRHCANRSLMERILAIALGEDDTVSWSEQVTSSAGTRKPAGTLLGDTADRTYVLANQTIPDLRAAIARIEASQQAMAGKDWVNEQQIIDGVLAGLGGRDLDEVVEVLVAAMGPDRASELGRRLTPTGPAS